MTLQEAAWDQWKPDAMLILGVCVPCQSPAIEVTRRLSIARTARPRQHRIRPGCRYDWPPAQPASRQGQCRTCRNARSVDRRAQALHRRAFHSGGSVPDIALHRRAAPHLELPLRHRYLRSEARISRLLTQPAYNQPAWTLQAHGLELSVLSRACEPNP